MEPARIALVVQARMGSSRLPGKVLTPVLGRPLLSYELERLRDVQGVAFRVVATTLDASDDPVARLAEDEGFIAVRGSVLDVLDRFVQAAETTGADTIIRATADCPLIDPDVIDVVVARFLEGEWDYVSNTLRRTYPRGLDVEVMRAGVLIELSNGANSRAEREHVTPFIYSHPERFSIGQVQQDYDASGERWTVDVPEDVDLVRRIIEALYPAKPAFRMRDIISLLDANPSWRVLNQHVQQRSHLDAEPA